MAGIRIHHMAITCKDMAATEQFYTKHFGFKRTRLVPLGETEIVFIGLDGVYLELFQAQSDESLPPFENDGPQYPTWRHLAFDVDDVDTKLAEMGDDADVALGPLSFDDFIPGWRAVWIKDPDGNVVEISQGYVDQEDPPPIQQGFVVV